MLPPVEDAVVSPSLEKVFSRRRMSPAVVFGGFSLFVLWFVLCRQLSGEWSINEQYNYGWFVPFFAAYLFWLRWEDRPPAAESPLTSDLRPLTSTARATALGTAIVALLILLPVRLFEVGNPDWRPLGWVHATAVAAITLVIIWAKGGRPWVAHFAFPIGFFFVAVPWISAVEQPIILGLMRTVAAVAAEAVNLCGIPAQVEGNLIRVSSGLVGVNEACSGVRSIQTSIMIGFLFGELKRLSSMRRVILVLSALAVAVLGNFGRAFFLVWIAATRQTQAVSSWHDIAGYSIVAAVFIATIALASKLAKGERRKAEGGNERLLEEKRAVVTSPFLLHPSSFILSIVWLVTIEIGVEAWYRSHESAAILQQRWTVVWPQNAPGFREIPIDEGVRATLRFDQGREAAWNTPGARCLLYFFRWEPGGASVVRARAHRPDICLPSAGWRQVDDAGNRSFKAADDLPLLFRRVSFLQPNGKTVAHTFFCLHEDRMAGEARPDLELAAGIQPDWSFPGRWRAVRNGVRNMGQQVMEFILLAPAEMTAEEAESRFAAMLPEMVRTQR